jgi:GlcNAc-P-P-Und epimerase
MKAIIFGGSGFIGTHIINYFSSVKPQVEVFNADIIFNDHSGKCKFIKCDVRKPISIEGIQINSSDLIFNLAAIHRTPGHPAYDYFETNIKGAENICEFARTHGIHNIIFTSSIAPYGAAEKLKKEDSLCTPNTPYGISKLVAEKTHQTWQAEDKNRNLLILRPGVVFGKGENGNFTRLYWALRKRRFFYPGRKDTTKAAIYVKDLVEFMMFELEKMNGGYSETFNCTYHPAYTIEQIVQTINQVTKVSKPLFVVPGGLLKFAASIIGAIGGRALGIHPDRVKKLMISTNISGEKLGSSGFTFKYGLKGGIEDWFCDNQKKSL